MLASQGRVFALEKSLEAISLTKANVEHFALENVQVLQTEAPTGLTALPVADIIMIGGSGGNLSQILTVCLEQLAPGGRIVLNAITIETLSTALHFLENNDFQEVDAVAITVARLNKVGQSHMWQGLNPVYIISATKQKFK